MTVHTRNTSHSGIFGFLLKSTCHSCCLHEGRRRISNFSGDVSNRLCSKSSQSNIAFDSFLVFSNFVVVCPAKVCLPRLTAAPLSGNGSAFFSFWFSTLHSQSWLLCSLFSNLNRNLSVFSSRQRWRQLCVSLRTFSQFFIYLFIRCLAAWTLTQKGFAQNWITLVCVCGGVYFEWLKKKKFSLLTMYPGK